MGDLGGCFFGCLWFLGWMALEIGTVVFTARYLGWFWAVVLGLFGIAAPWLLAAGMSRTAKSPEGPQPPA